MRNLNDIAIFVAVVREKSFSAAARALGLSASYVSKRIRVLEEDLETQLLKRSTHFLSLTESGEAFYRRSAEALAQLEEARNDALEIAEHLRGTLRVFAALGFGEYVLWRLVSEFSRLYPDINIQLEIGHRATNVLEIGTDIAIRSADLPDTSLDRRELGTLAYHLCAAPDYLRRAGRPARPGDLVHFNCLIHTAHHPADRWRFRTADGECTVQVSGNLRSNSGVVIHGACEQGLGVARLPRYIALPALGTGGLVELFPGQHVFSRELKAFYPRSRHTPTKVLAFLDFVAERLRLDGAARLPAAPLEGVAD